MKQRLLLILPHLDVRHGRNHIRKPRPSGRPPCIGLLIIAVLIASVALVLLAGCGNSPKAPALTETSARTVLYVGQGTSTSDRPALPSNVREAGMIAIQLDPNKDWLACFRIDDRTQEIRSKPAPPNEEVFLSDVVPSLRETSDRKGTNLAPFFIAVAERAKKCRGTVGVVCQSDWFGEGMTESDHAEVLAAAKILAANPKVAVVVASGVEPGNWEAMRRDLEPLSSKLLPFGPGQFDANAVRERMLAGGGLR